MLSVERVGAVVVAGGALLAALFLLTAPTVPQWGERHTPHDDQLSLTLTRGHRLGQSFRAEHSRIDGVLVWLNRSDAPGNATGKLALDVSAGGEQRTSLIDIADIPPSGLAFFPLEVLEVSSGAPAEFLLGLAESASPIGVRYQIDDSIYTDGHLIYPHPDKKGDLAFQIRYQRPALGTTMRQGGYALALLVAGALLAWHLWHMQRPEPGKFSGRSFLACLGLTVLVVTVYAAPLLKAGVWVGATDFSKDSAYLKAAAAAATARAWPMWSHLTCGGMALLGNPEGNTMSLGTIFAVLLPPDRALLLLLVTEAGIGAIGAYLLARSLGLPRLGSVFAAVVSLLSASYAYRIAEGLTPVGGAVAFLPWVFLGLRHSESQQYSPWTLLTGASIALTFLRGDVHLIVGIILVTVIWSSIRAHQLRSWLPWRNLLVAGALALLLGSLKIAPFLEQPQLIGGDTLKPYVVRLTQQGFLDDALLAIHDRDFILNVQHGRQGEHYGNFGAYVGIIPLLLAGLGVFVPSRYRAALILSALGAFVLSEGALFDLVLRHIPPLHALLRVPSRLFSIFVLFLGILAGASLEHLRAKLPHYGTLATVILTALVTINLSQATLGILTRNIPWDTTSLPAGPAEPTLMPHHNLNFSENNLWHPGKLIRAGYLLPHICGDQNNPPAFIRNLTSATPLVDFPARLSPNTITVAGPAGPSDIIIRERFSSAWISPNGSIVASADGAIHLLVPRRPAGPITVTYTSATVRTQKTLFILFLSILFLVAWPVLSFSARSALTFLHAKQNNFSN